MPKRLFAILKKEFKELLRDPLYLTFALIVPVVIIILMGYGLILDVKNIPVSFIDHDRTQLSREYRFSFTNSEYFRFYKLINSYKEAEELIQSGECRIVVAIPPDFSRKLYGGKPVQVQILIDGSFPMRAEVMKGYVSAINMQFNQKILKEYADRQGISQLNFPVSVETRAWYNPALESKNFILPGELVTTLMFYSVLLASLIVVREKESGSIFNLYCSPVKSWEVVFGKAIPYVSVSFVTYLIIFALTVGLFQTKFTGNFLFLTFSTIVYLFCTVGVGVFISILAKTQITAMLIAFLGSIIPSFIYSGYFSPITSMSATGQLISKTIPASYFMVIVRGVYLKGIGIESFMGDLISLFIYASIVYGLAILSFRKRIG
ncbi:ABC transporter permease [Thermodesulfovibrio yellowstonii]|uniref:ABC transporter permease n=1 Tax=Thermodesulfovibrio yellowstonii TaxID=28262 RepID=UPI001EF9F07E|nr:ABC transporter permease [Thermodesulfovibrio islandicus]